MKTITPNTLMLILISVFITTARAQEQKSPWFYYERALPNDSIPPDSYKNALDQQWVMRQNVGYRIAPQTAAWTSIGPSNAPKTGRVVRVKYEPNQPIPTDGNTVYICSNNGGVWKSTNGGTNFYPICDQENIQTQCSGDIAIDPQDHNTLYWGTGGSIACWPWFNYYGIGVYKSTDGGNSWSGPYRGGELPSLTHTSTIVVNPSNRHVYLANCLGTGPFGGPPGAGLYKSTDGGLTWVRVNLQNQPLNQGVWDVVVSSTGQYVYTVSSTGYWRSSNYGASFDYMDPEGTGFYQNGRTQIAVSGDYVYIVTDRGGNNHAFTSTDGGRIFYYRYQNLGWDFDCMSADFMFVQASPVDPQLAFIGYGGMSAPVWRTTNGGQNWTTVYQMTDQNNFAFNPVNPLQAIICTDEGLYRSNDILSPLIVSFPTISYSLSLRQNYRVASHPYDALDMVMAAEDAGFFKYRPDLGPNKWLETSLGGDGASMVHSRGAVDGFLGNKAISNEIYRSTNGGVNWSSYNLPGYWDADEDWIAPIVEKPGALGTFYCPRRNSSQHEYIDINVTTNYGENWTANPPPMTRISSTNVSWSPNSISFSDANTGIIYVSTHRWPIAEPPSSQVWKTTDGGITWNNLEIQNHGASRRLITSVVADPKRQNVVYLTYSGFGNASDEGHVFKSANGGQTWANISNLPDLPGSLPNLPVNYMIIRSISNSLRELVIATDAGVYSEYDSEVDPVPLINWKEVASGLPNCPCLGLDYNVWGGKLRAALFGRGIWQVQFPGPVYVVGSEVLASVGEGLDVADDIVIDSGSTLNLPYNCTIKMPADKKIIVKDAGSIDASSGSTITLTSQSGTWGGIEFQGSTSSAALKNITFTNTHTPITISGDPFVQPNNIKIQNCTFNDGYISIDSRGNVDIENCTFNYSGSYDPLVQAVSSVGSNDITIQRNTVNSNASLTGTAISVVYGSSDYIVDNTIHDAYNGISISNSDPYVSGNTLTHSQPNVSNDGIGTDNCNSPSFSSNSVSGYTSGIKLGNSSPVLLSNSTLNSGANYSMYVESQSFPRMAPLQGGGELIYDAGYNALSTANNTMYVNTSIPVTDLGCNNFTAGANRFFIEGEMDILSYPPSYNATHNYWNFTPTQQNFNIDNGAVTVYFDPTGCGQPGGGGDLDPIAERASETESSEEVPPPQPIIVDRGNGFYDTILVKSSSISSSQDKILFAQGTKEELLGHYQNAVNIFLQLIQSYPHSQSSMKALGSIISCYEKNHADSSNYAALRNNYITFMQAHLTDTLLTKIVRNLAAKTLVKMKLYPAAITEYEYIITHSNDSLETLFAELNIIETYMLIHQGGDAPSFTGKLTYLKPSNIQDGLRMIREKYHSANKKTKMKVVPKEFKLAQNYPNPFNPTTTISYNLPHDTKVNIKIYDLLGRLVKELVNEYKTAGIYNVKFDGADFASGVYFYRIEAGTFVDTKKMVLVK